MLNKQFLLNYLLLCCLFCTTSICFASSSSRPYRDVLGTWHEVNFDNMVTGQPLLLKTSEPLYNNPDWLLERSFTAKEKFDTAAWRKMQNRNIQLSLFVHEFELIGMERTKVHELLGQPETLFKPNSSPDPSRTDTEWYLVSAPRFCVVNSDQPNSIAVFEIGFANNKVKGFRTVVRKTGRE